ncbi:hypothetical protein SCUCBS95973_002131 [Sporothrix curviconia]|uniref:acylphosphatase n=1 Tax=Sporothrix curviconia TaxID=1260050 RepID=A0ABP0B4B1_9PEZI
MAVKRVYFLAHGGTVQGVGYRLFAQRKARLVNVTGWVRNLPNNKVEGEVQGEEADVATLLQRLDRGPPMAHVVRFDKEDREVVEGEASFEVRRG